MLLSSAASPVMIRQQADWAFYEGCMELAADGRFPMKLRRKSHAIGRHYKALWIDLGLSGLKPPKGFCFKVHGRWCGPCHGAGLPVDALDMLCRQHDLAYEKAEMVELLV